jgi:hypothetical protein
MISAVFYCSIVPPTHLPTHMHIQNIEKLQLRGVQALYKLFVSILK